MQRRCFRLPLEQFTFVRAILEGYDGLAQFHAPDPNRGECEWIIAEGREAEAEELVQRLANVGLVEIARF